MTAHETEVELPVRYRDIDTLGHVNNAVYVTYLEQARVEYIREVLGTTPDDPGFVVAHISVDYERAIGLGETVVVALGVTGIGQSSVTMEYEIRTDGALAATAETTIVALGETGDPTPIPEGWRERITAHEGRTL
ncbi:MAG: putative thioesterase [halophilic archaeon J07HX64]|jgi:Predicted thioesterase|nr:MAG: putative thioesterase [halophilic archaeon J07HX64]